MSDEIPATNPVKRARQLVEAEVPASKRGPGWDRHWRELEAYVETVGSWSVPECETDTQSRSIRPDEQARKRT